MDKEILTLPVLLAVAWMLPWKGIALWKAARNSHKIWFVAILITSSMALLEIVYIFFFVKKKEIKPGL